MKVICDRGVLVDALNLLSGVVVSRTPKPVLLCVKLAADNGRLALAATDLEVALHLVLEQVDVQDQGAVLVPADKFSAIVRESVDPTVSIESDSEGVHFRGADSHFKIFSQSVEEFPAVEASDGEPDFVINAGQLQELITRTLFATARETSRYAINGVLFEWEGKKLTLVATDGRRLALAKGTCSQPQGEGRSSIIPVKALNLLVRLMDDPAADVKVKITDNQARFSTNGATLTTSLVEGNFPPYRDVIPKEHDRKAVFAADALASAVRRAALLTNEESKGVRFAFSSDQLKLTSRAPEMGEAEVTVPVESFTGEPIEIGFNPHFITDVLKVCGASEVAIEMKAPNKPGTIKAGGEFLYVVMPVSLN